MDLDEAEFDGVIEVDRKGMAPCMQAELKQFHAQGDGGAIDTPMLHGAAGRRGLHLEVMPDGR